MRLYSRWPWRCSPSGRCCMAATSGTIPRWRLSAPVPRATPAVTRTGAVRERTRGAHRRLPRLRRGGEGSCGAVRRPAGSSSAGGLARREGACVRRGRRADVHRRERRRFLSAHEWVRVPGEWFDGAPVSTCACGYQFAGPRHRRLGEVAWTPGSPPSCTAHCLLLGCVHKPEAGTELCQKHAGWSVCAQCREDRPCPCDYRAKP